MTRLASAATVAFAAVAGKSLSMAGDYDAAMRSVQAKTGATGAVLDKLSEQAREMGRTTVHSATEAARGQAFLAQAGFDANEVLAALPGTLNLATAGELGLAEAADIASNVLTGFALDVSEADRVADVLALTANSTNTNVQQMGNAMKFAANVAAAADADFEETAAAIGLLANAGFQGEMGGTALRGAMSKLLNPTNAAQKILDKLGISAVTSTGGLKPLHEIVGQFEDVGLTAGDAMKIFGQRAGPGMLALVSQGSDALVELTGELKNAEGTAKKTADIMGGGLWGAMKKVQSIVESAFISFGERLAPAVIWVANVFADLPGPIQEVVVVVGSLVGAMGGLMLIMPQSFGSLVQFPGKLARLATSINLVRVKTIAMTIVQKAATAAQWLFNAAMTANPIGLVIAAIGLLVVAWITWDDEIMAFLRGTWDKVKKGFYAFKGWVTEAFGVLKGWLDKIPTPILALLGPVGLVLTIFRKWDDIKRIAQGVYGGIKRWMSDKLGTIFNGIKSKVDSVVGFFSRMKDKIVGNSIVPDMVNLVGGEFGRMNKSMVDETEDAVTGVAESLQKMDAAVNQLIDTWTGATLKSKEFLEAFARLTPEQKKNDRIMKQVIGKYESLRAVLGPFDDELEGLWHTNNRLNRELEAQEIAQKAVTKAQEYATKQAVDLNDRLEAQRQRLLGLPTADAIRDFKELTRTWEGLNEAEREVATQRYAAALLAAAEAGNTLTAEQIALAQSAKAATQSASGYDLALASLAGQMGGATGQAMNLVIAMREHNKEQKAAAAAGKATEGQFSKMRVGAAGVATGFHALGEVVGGTAGKILGELGNIAAAFAKGGIAGAIMAGISAIARGIAGLFSRGRKKREAAAKRELKAAEEQAARMRELAEAQEQYWDSVYGSAINAYDRAQAAGVAAYDKIYLAALESGLSQEEAIAKATAAQIDASEKILKAEGDKFVRMAAFEAALDAIRSGNAAGAAAAARKAAADTRLAWETALEAIAEADSVTTDAMSLSSTELTNQIIDDTKRAAAARTTTVVPPQNPYGGGIPGIHGDIPGDQGYLGRQHGGSVVAGRKYRVGETGPEMFVSSERGRIEPNGSSGGGMDAKALGQAVANALEGTEIKVDGRKLGRLTVRHQPLAATELGGRR